MKYKVGDEVRVKRTNKETMYKHIEGTTVWILNNVCDDLYLVIDCVGGQRVLNEEMLEPADSKTLRMADGTVIGEFAKEGIIGEFKGIPVYATGGTVSIHDLPTSEWYNPMRLTFKNGSSIEALPQKDDAVRGENHFCNGFRGGKIPNDLIVSHTEMERAMDGLSAWATNVQLDKETVFNGLSQVLKRATEVYSFPKEDKKLKFTFYVTDWVDINKTNGEKIPMKRTVAYIGSNTDVEADTSCPMAEYDERIGCLIAAAKISAKRSTEAKMMYNIARSTWGTELSWAILFELANTAFNGNFERVYKKFHNDNIRFEKKRLTCNFCGKVFETIEEKTKHENEHIQNKKNKREKYLIRKEAKRRLAEAEREGKIEQTMKELYKK